MLPFCQQGLFHIRRIVGHIGVGNIRGVIFNAVDLIVSLTDGGPNRGTTTLALYIMNTFTGSYDYGYASALAVISTLIMMVVAFVYIRFGKMGQTDN